MISSRTIPTSDECLSDALRLSLMMHGASNSANIGRSGTEQVPSSFRKALNTNVHCELMITSLLTDMIAASSSLTTKSSGSQLSSTWQCQLTGTLSVLMSLIGYDLLEELLRDV